MNSGFITITQNPFTNASGLDFSLNTLQGGGGSLRAAGYPGTFPSDINTTGYPDIGAAQHQDSGGAAVTRSMTFVQ
jgi:hypothetical protein